MKRLIYLMVVGIALLLAACGEAEPTTNITVIMTDFMFQPSQFIVPAGEQITVSTANNGAVVHNFVVMKLGETAGPVFDEDDIPNVYWELELQPGGSTDTSFPAPTEPGEYEVICRTEGHIASGMVAKLVVVPGE
jgi:uncharacterized cupredoxin-like copper-binding protein